MAVTLAQLETKARARADMEVSGFVSTSLWTIFLNEAYEELWDLVQLAFGDHVLTSVDFTISGSAYTYTPPSDFYLLRGVDRDPGLSTAVSLPRFNFAERNEQLYGPLCYRLRGSVIEIQPHGSAAGNYRLWYVPGYTPMTSSVDMSPVVEKWHEFVSISAAIKALAKEESDTGPLEMALQRVTKRIQDMAPARDSGAPEKIARTRKRRVWPYLLGGSSVAAASSGGGGSPSAPGVHAVTIAAVDDERATGAPVTSVTIASAAVTSGVPVLLVVAMRGGIAPAISGSGLTWTLVASATDGTGASSNLALYLFKCVPSSTGSVAVTATCNDSNTTGVSVSLYSLTGASGAVPQSASATATGATSAVVNLGAFASSNNATFGAIIKSVSGGFSAGGGFTALFQDVPGASGRVSAESKAGSDTSVDWTWSGADTYVAIALEIEAA